MVLEDPSSMSGCIYVTKINLSNFFRNRHLRFFTLHDDRGINIYRMVKVPCRFVHWVPFFGPFLGPILPKTNTLLIFSKTAPRGFFKPRIRIGDINTYQIAKIASKLIHFFRSYSPKTGLPMLYFDETVGISDWCSRRSGKCRDIVTTHLNT